MHREDELDALLESRARGYAPPASTSEDLAPLLAAAARLDSLRDAAPSSAFTSDLEARLLARMALAPAQPATKPVPLPAQRRHWVGAPSRLTWAAVAAVLLLTVGLGAFTAKAAPGAPLYAVRQFAQKLAAQAIPTADPLSHLAQARSDLAAYDAAIVASNEPAALTALGKLRADDAYVAESIAQVSDTTARQQAQTQLAAFRSEAQPQLRASLASLDWRGRAQVTDALRAWGDSALVVTHARVQLDASSAQGTNTSQSAGTLLIDAHGAGFSGQAQLLVNGQPGGQIVSQSATDLIVRVTAKSLSSEDAGALAIGVENADGTVAYTSQVERDDHGAPGASETPSPSDHNGDHSGSTNGSGDTTSTKDATHTPTPEESPSPTPLSTATPSS